MSWIREPTSGRPPRCSEPSGARACALLPAAEGTQCRGTRSRRTEAFARGRGRFGAASHENGAAKRIATSACNRGKTQCVSCNPPRLLSAVHSPVLQADGGTSCASPGASPHWSTVRSRLLRAPQRLATERDATRSQVKADSTALDDGDYVMATQPSGRLSLKLSSGAKVLFDEDLILAPRVPPPVVMSDEDLLLQRTRGESPQAGAGVFLVSSAVALHDE